MAQLNCNIILRNLGEAAGSLEALCDLINQGNALSNDTLQVELEHIYHHLNVAWNARYASDERYKNLGTDDFNRWSKFPKAIKAYHIDTNKGPKLPYQENTQ